MVQIKELAPGPMSAKSVIKGRKTGKQCDVTDKASGAEWVSSLKWFLPFFLL